MAVERWFEVFLLQCSAIEADKGVSGNCKPGYRSYPENQYSNIREEYKPLSGIRLY